MNTRGQFEGVWNIVRFNWPMFAVGGVVVAGCVALGGWWRVLGWLIAFGVTIPLAVSHWVYDRSDLYRLHWLDPKWKRVVSLHAGFDEISGAIRENLPAAEVLAFDFYDPRRHTEPSIERARRYARTGREVKTISTLAPLPVPPGTVDAVLLFLSAHEIRDSNERAQFFQHLKATLKPEGCVVVVEHIRDMCNFITYSVGAFHFHSDATWKETFARAGLKVESIHFHTPLVCRYFLLVGQS
ncbi:MAG: class I SAM-dependent methyltransferase [Verrucomicrobiaceae bacterium]|nr:class I SAM-dependent methyltransferase [Verrucomicrobiaceae bacterium]